MENLIGSAFHDTLAGDTNNILCKGNTGSEALYGAGGIDTADYSGATAGMTADLSVFLAGNDGQGGGTLTNIENLMGSIFSDTLAGDGNANQLEGRGGADSFVFISGSGMDNIFDFVKGQSEKIHLQSNLNGSGITWRTSAGTHDRRARQCSGRSRGFQQYNPCRRDSGESCGKRFCYFLNPSDVIPFRSVICQE
jgi:hypothetical protein